MLRWFLDPLVVLAAEAALVAAEAEAVPVVEVAAEAAPEAAELSQSVVREHLHPYRLMW